jgi:hypothetical protein
MTTIAQPLVPVGALSGNLLSLLSADYTHLLEKRVEGSIAPRVGIVLERLFFDGNVGDDRVPVLLGQSSGCWVRGGS